MNEQEILRKIKDAYQNILTDKLVGIYVHGSIAFQCFNPNASDIDFLVVVNARLKQFEKEALISTLLDLDDFCPPKGMEMSVILETVCNPFVYPTPFELHFSNAHKETCKNDLIGYCRTMYGTDKDLAAHITVINQVGITLCGKAIAHVFAPVPERFYIDSILTDVCDANNATDENLVYYVLNLCRVMAYLKDGLVLSKRQGGEWGKVNLPIVHRAIIKKALSSYTQNTVFTSDIPTHAFINDMLEQISQNIQ